ncbi:unnamed protein product [Leptidea sinapis]|uniref:Uncharacterized protein n=1 Tax=Leptidea sinapis TaxID=189913 RepID=A0A5E4QCY3_9NEOP|nr:unnamed protein product [Leptidea sinapis]
MATNKLKPCVSAPTCSVHRHRPQPPPCPNPETCYKKGRKSFYRCPSSTATVSRFGTPCECERENSRNSRLTRKKSFKTHKKRIREAYSKRSMESRWRRRKKCCTIL